MKKILSLVFALIAIGHVNANGIEPKSPVGMSVIKSGAVVKVFYQGEQTGKVKVTIYNERGQTVYMETLQNTGNFMRPYNFSFLPEGEYTIELIDDQGKRVKTIAHSHASRKRIAHLTRLNDGETKYMLAVPSNGRNAFTIRIFDEQNNLRYQESQITEGDFAKIYNLNNIEGDHTFEIVDQNGKTDRLTKFAK